MFRFFLLCWVLSFLFFSSCKEKIKSSDIEPSIILPIDTLENLLSEEVQNIDESISPIKKDIETVVPTERNEVENKKVINTNIQKEQSKLSPSQSVLKNSHELHVQKSDNIENVDKQTHIELKNEKPVLPEPLPIKDDTKKVVLLEKPNHNIWDKLLKKYVSSNGSVDYKSMLQDKMLLNDYISSLAGPFDMKSWSPNEKLAFWINTYNAFTIKLIVDNYPVRSIRDLFGGQPWSQSLVFANNTHYTLDEVQKKIIMRQFGDPRIHFAINCAAKSCPPLANKAYTKDNVNTLLETQTKSFINSNYNNIDNKKATLSKIFEWYASDFEDIIYFVNKYSTNKVNDKTKINFSEYDWSLNGQ